MTKWTWETWNNHHDHICNKIATPAKIHFKGFSFDFRLKVQTNVGPLDFVLYTGQSYIFLKSCLSWVIALIKMTGIVGKSS